MAILPIKCMLLKHTFNGQDTIRTIAIMTKFDHHKTSSKKKTTITKCVK